MQVSIEQINTLLQLQDIDKSLISLKARFEELPQRQKIIDARSKLAQLKTKAEQVETLKRENNKKISASISKDESLEKRQAALQSDIEASNDFRNIEKKTKELAGIQRLREECAQTLESLETDEKKISTLRKQIDQALQSLAHNEETLIESFRQEGGNLQQEIAMLEKKRSGIIDSLDKGLKDSYERIIASGAGIALGKLDNGCCSVCRWRLQDNQLINVRKQAPLATCPNCKRFLVVGQA